MKHIERTTQFKKDLKKYLNNPKAIAKLLEVVRLLEYELPIPTTMRPHKLSGNYLGCMECHVANDFLLVWIDEKRNVIRLLRVGSHSELF